MKCLLVILLILSPFRLYSQHSLVVEVKTGPSIGTTIKYQPYSSDMKASYDVSVLIGIKRSKLTYGSGLYFFSLGSNFQQDIRLPGKVKKFIKTSFDIHYLSVPLFTKYSFNEWNINLGVCPSLSLYARGADEKDHKIVDGNLVIDNKRIQKESTHFESTNVINPFLLTSYLEIGRDIKIIHKKFYLGLKYTRNITRAININPAFHSDYEKFYSFSLQIGHTLI